ncbi:hypothetical protein H9638_04340 [Arthrobacter sp. Sa2BUA2]|uniref:Uncharacterized protein n=1 Tax=Arthrobacter pullicola TaxID=2762224 RepID=A0ABR8YFM6_9MICC|nr:hypothetical protein [Arthrobacter pullicola]MBD8043036.1 hypothetical protein [Arthrobacter pullicola]
MARERRRWKYRDPSWFQIGWLYLLAVVFALPGDNPSRTIFAMVWAVPVTVLAVFKVIRRPTGSSSRDAE